MKRKVGIIGGAFNPPHNAHIKLGKYARRYFHLQELIYIPTNIPSHKSIDGRWGGSIRSLMIKTALFYENPERIREELQRIVPGKEGIDLFIKEYMNGYRRFHKKFISVSDIEINNNQTSFTIDTVKKLLKLEPDIEPHIIIGMDQAAVLDTWKDYNELSKIAVFCAAERPGINMEEIHNRFPFVRFFPFPEIEISSSIIRQRLDAGLSIRGMVPPIMNELLMLLCSS
jgi:nicotinate-nucleotide adenylyltransferase